MYIPKRYGQSKVAMCPFCSKPATINNKDGVPTCVIHKNSKMPDLKCLCREYLDLRTGKFGPFFQCIKCGNINFKKALEWNEKAFLQTNSQGKSDFKTQSNIKIDAAGQSQKVTQQRKETIITPNDVDYF